MSSLSWRALSIFFLFFFFILSARGFHFYGRSHFYETQRLTRCSPRWALLHFSSLARSSAPFPLMSSFRPRSPPFLLPLRGDPVLFRAFIYFPFCLTVVDGGRSSREEPTAAPAEAEERGYRCQLSGTGTRSRTGCRTTP